jgi:hypothetical protein
MKSNRKNVQSHNYQHHYQHQNIFKNLLKSKSNQRQRRASESNEQNNEPTTQADRALEETVHSSNKRAQIPDRPQYHLFQNDKFKILKTSKLKVQNKNGSSKRI